MNAAVSIMMLVAAGVALVCQNVLMVRITGAVSTVVITLVLNSAVGLVLLLGILLARTGVPGLTEAAAAFRPWTLLPGMLGSFFVFASILGYQRVGAATTVSVLVASQLIAGIVADQLKTGGAFFRPGYPVIIGAILLVAGAFIVARGRL